MGASSRNLHGLLLSMTERECPNPNSALSVPQIPQTLCRQILEIELMN
jgi:hypothetical protein